MLRSIVPTLAAASALVVAASAQSAAPRPIRLPLDVAVSPDGRHVAFSFEEDVWIASTSPESGEEVVRARRLTVHPAEDVRPAWSPDGNRIAFQSDRAGGDQVFVVEVDGLASGAARPRQVTFDSLPKSLAGFHPDGERILLRRTSDESPFWPESPRLFAHPLEGDGAEEMLFDCGFDSAAVSPDGSKILFTRGRAYRTRKGYRGPQALQLWIAEKDANGVASVRRLYDDAPGFLAAADDFPMWLPGGDSFLFLSERSGVDEIWRDELTALGDPVRVTDVVSTRVDGAGSDDGVEDPSLSADGRTLVYRRLFDLRVRDLESGEDRPLPLVATGDPIAAAVERLSVDRAGSIAFTPDGKQMAFVAGHDLYVMDRILREPVRLTSDAAIEGDPVFSQDGKRLLFVSEAGGEVDIWQAELEREDGIWWLAESGEVALRQMTDDRAVESGLRRSPTGKHFAYLRDSELFVMDEDGDDRRRVVSGWDQPSFDWSPDGRWIVYAQQDDDFNSEIWLLRLDGTSEPFNLSRHPDNDGSPVWSGDGERIAWVGRRTDEEWDIHYVTLTKDEAEETERDRRLAKALEASGKKEKTADGGKDGKTGGGEERPAKRNAAEEFVEGLLGAVSRNLGLEKDEDAVRVDLDGIHDRIRRISVPDSYEGALLWSPDGDWLLFRAVIDGDRGVWGVEFPDVGKPKKLASSLPGGGEWLAETKEVVGLDGGVPAAAKVQGGKVSGSETFAFSTRQTRDWREVRKLTFDQGWRAMRDRFYDEALNGRDWQAVRAKYRDVGAELLGRREFSVLMNMMLGELNASHMGHRGGSDPLPDAGSVQWTPTTWQLGLRFDRQDEGPGLLVESVVPGSPCDLARSKVEVGERVLAVDGVDVAPGDDLLGRLTMVEVRDVELRVQDAEGEARDVVVRPESPGALRGRLYDEWVEARRAEVDEWSGGRFGYLHIQGMNQSSFLQFEEDLYAAGFGKDGLLIDVRYNGGGSTADRVLTVLTQPRHAVTIPRGGGEGYPQDRKVFASWHKPIVLLCNQYSFSNAEILSHAIKTLGRGPVVGMRTAGGVISTGYEPLMDGSGVRMPFRGWFVKDTGDDMELNGAMPDHVLWNDPASDFDAQLRKAVEVLGAEVEEFVDHADPVPASARRGRGR
jgi:tricorn protease